MRTLVSPRTLLAGAAFLAAAAVASAPALAGTAQLDPREVHLADLEQLSFGGENAEAYWSPDGSELILQTTRPPYDCDQIMRLKADGSGEPVLVSTGTGRTTCSYFFPKGDRVLFSSTHLSGDACPPPPDRSHGYVWAVYSSYEIFTARPDGSDLVRLTNNDAYDAESTICPLDGSIVFTSTRDGDLDLYRMDADGGNVKRLTNTPGYDGGAFFSADCKQIVWRASRPRGAELEEYQGLLARGLVRPGQLELWVANADGTEAHQVTNLGAASFAPYFFPSGKRIIFSSNYGDPKGREFELWAVNVDGTGLERITWSDGFDGFPIFSPDGQRIAFSSNRNQGKPGETNVFVARWVDSPPVPPSAQPPAQPSTADRFGADVAWLADDAREGRGIGTAGLAQAADWLEARFRALGLAPAGEDGGYRQAFEVPTSVAAGPSTAVEVDGKALAAADFRPAPFSLSGTAEGEVVAAGYGIVASAQGIDDYAGVDAKGKVVVVRRFTPEGPPFDQDDVVRRLSDLRYKAYTAREHGAAGLIVVDLPVVAAGQTGQEAPAEAALPELSVDQEGDAGIPVVTLTRAAGAVLFAGAHRARLSVALVYERKPAYNIAGKLAAGAAARQPGAVLVGAHYDHLGFGDSHSLAPGVHEVHNGADDNASGTAALLEVARELAARRADLDRDVYFVAFSGEESGVLGSTAFTRQPPGGLKIAGLVAMLNMDMVGRLRENRLAVLGKDSGVGWNEVVEPRCVALGLDCSLGGDGYGPSDQTPFYASGVPVLHFFTGNHADYHKPSDDADKINAEGGARVAALVAGVAETLADRPERIAYHSVPAPAPRGDVRSHGASLGTVPDYAGPPDGRPGVLLAGVRAGSPAEAGGLQRGDLLVALAGHEIRDIHDFVYVLRQAMPGQQAIAVVERDGKRLELAITFGESQRVR